MKKIAEFKPMSFTPLTGPGKKEYVEGIKWWNKHLSGFKQTWDYNADSGLKKIYQKGIQIRLVTMIFGNTTIYRINKEEMEAEFSKVDGEDNLDGWERIAKPKLANMKL